MLLPSDRYFLQHLKAFHNVEITENDLRALDQFHFELNQEWQNKLGSDPSIVYYDIENGRVLGALAFGALGFFAAPIFGATALTGALIGASIGWRLVGAFAPKESQDKEAKAAQIYGFDSAPSIVPLGGAVNLIFCNRSINPKGGVRITGNVVYSRINTFGGTQRLLALYTLGVGELGQIDQSLTLINGQPLSNFFSDEITTYVNLGSLNQSLLGSDFTYYSQTQSTASNNQLGIDKRSKAANSQTNKNYINISDQDEFETFAPSDRYQINGVDFKIVSRDTANKRLYTDKNLTYSSGAEVYATYTTLYTSSKKCTELHLNFVANLWARDSSNKLKAHGVLADVYVDGTRVTRFFISNKNESAIRRRLILSNLSYDYHTIKIVPLVSASGGYQIIKLTDQQNDVTVSSGVSVGGRVPNVRYEGFIETESNANTILSFSGKEQVSSDRGATTQLTTVCEIVQPTDIGHYYFTTFKGLSIAGINVLASNRLNSDPSPNWFVKKGIIGRTHLSAGTAGTSSSGATLNDLTANFSALNNTSYTIRNLDKGKEAKILSASTNTIVAQSSLNWSVGDRYLVYSFDSLVYFPDIFVWTLTSKQGGLGGILPGSIIADYFIDYPSIVKSRNFCISNSFYWDGVIGSSVPWQQWVNQESLTSLLFPTRFGGRFGLLPEQQTNPVALFNSSNILNYTEDYAPKQLLNCVHVTYRDGSDTNRSVERTVSIMTQNAFNGVEKLFPESLKFDAVTNKNQAIKIGQTYLKTRVNQTRAINFSTALQGYQIREGDLIIVQHIMTEIDKECSGFVTAVNVVSSGVNRVKLSNPFKYGLTGDYSAAVYDLSSNLIQRNLSCQTIVITEDDTQVIYLEISGLTANLSASTDNLPGDYVVVGRDVEDRRTYRVNRIEPQDDGSVSISAVLWRSDMLDFSNLITVD